MLDREVRILSGVEGALKPKSSTSATQALSATVTVIKNKVSDAISGASSMAERLSGNSSHSLKVEMEKEQKRSLLYDDDDDIL